VSTHCYRCSRCGSFSRIWDEILRFTTASQPRVICRDSVACGERAKAASKLKKGEEVWLHPTNTPIEPEVENDAEPDTEPDEIEIENSLDGDDWSDLE